MVRINILIVFLKEVRENDINWKDEKVRLIKELGILFEIRGKDRCKYI